MRKVFFASALIPWILWAALRVLWFYPRCPLDECLTRLGSHRFLLPGMLRRPLWLRGLVDRLLPVLPPWGGGRCFKRSLTLLDLWSRCDLNPDFYMGVKAGEDKPEGHAWLAADGLPPSEKDEEYDVIYHHCFGGEYGSLKS